MLLEGKNVIIYGAGGSIGGGVARRFAADGARLFLTGRSRPGLDQLATDVAAAGGSVDVAVVDALDEAAVDAHVASVVAAAGSVDVSLNLVSRGDVQGTALVDMSAEDLTAPITTGVTTNFLTARAAARQMVRQGSGAILALNSGSAHGSPMMGGTGPADAAIDTFIRNLAVEVGPSGVRALGVWAAGIPETITSESLAAVNPAMRLDDDALAGLLAQLDAMRLLRRSPRLADIAATLAFLASDQAAAITGTFVNVTGMFPS